MQFQASSNLATVSVADDLVAGEGVGQATGVAAALHVVLAAQGRYAGPRGAQLAGRERQVEQPVRVGGAVRVLRDAHAPDQARAAEGRAGVDPGRLRDVLGGHSRDSRGVVEVVLVDDAAPLVKTLGPVAYEGLVVQPLVQDDLGHGVQEGDVGARPRPEPQLGEVAHLYAPRVDDDELGPTLDHGPPHPRRRHGVVRVGVGADYHEAARLLVVDVRVAGRAAAEGREHRLDRRRMAEPRAVVDVVRLHDDAGELLLHVAVLVRRLGRAQGRELVAVVLREALGDVVQRLLPRDRNELALAADQRRREAVLVVHERVPEPTLDAQHSQAGLVVGSSSISMIRSVSSTPALMPQPTPQ